VFEWVPGTEPCTDMASDLKMELLNSILGTKSVEFQNGLDLKNDLTE
jgi:hypothetical protein